MPKSVSCIVRSYAHELEDAAFTRLREAGTPITGRVIDKQRLELRLTDVGDICADEKGFVTNAHAHINYFLVGLNAASLGLFLHDSVPGLSPTYRYNDDPNKFQREGSVVDLSLRKVPIIGDLTEPVVFDAQIIYGYVARESDQELVSEYLKGLVHLTMSYPGADFLKDAFANFYKVFEYIATVRILKQTKLGNEVRELSQAILNVGLDSECVDEFKALYALRSSQIMHAQQSMRTLDIESVLKMKVLTDVLVRSVYKKAWGQRASEAIGAKA